MYPTNVSLNTAQVMMNIEARSVYKSCETILLCVRLIVMGSELPSGGVISVLFRYLDQHHSSGIKVWYIQVSGKRSFFSKSFPLKIAYFLRIFGGLIH